jgi:uncharacterized repeat protein (TIGR01451 family)
MRAGAALSCTVQNQRPTVAVFKIVNGTAPDGGKFNLTVSGGRPQTEGVTNPAINVSSGGGTTTVGVDAGSTVTISETAGTLTSLSNYTATVDCPGITVTPVSGTPGAYTFTAPSASAPMGGAIGGRDVTCYITNKPATLQIRKAWGAGAVSGNVASIGATTGGSNNTALFTATAPTAGDSGTAVAIAVGNTITLPAETMPTGTLASYNTVLACTANGGATANALSGTNGQVTNTLLIDAADAGKAIVCTYTNMVAPRVLLGKGPGAGPVANTTFNFTMTGLSRATAAITTTHLASVFDPVGASIGSVGVPVTITEVGIPAEWSNYISSMGCSDSNSAVSGNPASFAATVSGNVATIPAANMRANASLTCTVQNRRPSIIIGKVVVGTAPDGGKFNLTVSGGRPQTELVTNPAIDVSSGGWGMRIGVDAGSTVTISETAGTLTSLSNYTATANCGPGVTVTPVSGTPGAFTLTAPSASAPATGVGGRDLDCTITNKPNTATLQVSKAWGAGAVSGNVASIGATTGGTNNTALFTATAPTAGNSGAAVTVVAGNTITLPAETMPTGTLASYNTVLACTANGGATANALSGTNGQVTNTLLIGLADVGKAIACTYTNTPKTATLQLSKTWGAGAISGNVASIGATTGGTNNTALFTATAPTAGNSSTVNVVAGNTITLPAETMPTGTLASYNTVLACTANGGATANALSGTNGQVTNTLLIDAADAGKAIVCTYTNTPKTATLQLAKTWGAGSTTGNVASIGATTGGTNNTALFTATAPTAGNSGTAVAIAVGNTITLPAETMPTGTLASYNTVLACTAGGGATANALSGANGQVTNTLLIGPADAGKAILCTYTNTPKTATLQLSKAWGAGAISGHVASIGASTGGTNNTALFTATAPTAGDSGTAVAIAVGNTITLPAETMPTGTLASYNTVLACTANGGATANALSGTNGQVTNTLLIDAADAGKAIVCTYTNTGKPATLTIAKRSLGGVGGFDFTGTNGVAAHTITTTVAGMAVNGPVQTLTATGTATTVTETYTAPSPAETPDYVITDVSCTGMGSGGTVTRGSFQNKNQFTLNAAATVAGSNIVCTVTNAKVPTLQLRKKWVNALVNDVVRLSASGTVHPNHNVGYAFYMQATANTPNETDTGNVQRVAVGDTVTLGETPFGTNAGSYTSSAWSCTGGGSLSGNLLTLGDADAGLPIVCEITNTRRTATLQLAKAWSAGSTTGNVASIGATTGGASNTAAFTATAPTAGTSGTAVSVATGDTLTFPAETMTTGTLANYTTVLSCTADGGATANPLSGTNGQASNTLVVGAGDADKAIVCTYSNNRLPTVQIRKQALGGTGTFAFSGTNGFGSDSINVSVSGSTVVGTIKTLTAANTQTVLTEVAASMPGGFAFSGATCTGLAGGATAAVDLVAGTVTLPAAGLTNGTAVVCTFTNTLAAIVSGRVFLDNGVGSGTANDGLVNGGEGPLSGVSVRLTNCGATVYASALTDASGAYSLSVPAGTATGSAMCVEETNPGTRVSTGASVGSVALPSGSAVAAAGGTYTYTRTGTPDRIAFSWNGTGHANLNFGDVDNSAFATDGAKTGLPGSTVTYAHTFTAGTAGQVRFSVASETATPAITGWTTKVFADVGCTGSLQASAAQLYPPSAAATPVAFAGKVCVIVQEFIPATAPLGSNNKATIRADFTYTNASPSLSGSFTLDDLTTVSGVALELKKEVRNITQSGTFGVNNQAKSGETLEYRITYTNNGDAPIRSMVVNDMTPGYTTFVSATTGTTPASLTGCVKTTPANAPPAGAVACTTVQPSGGTGAVDWRFTGTVEPGGTGFVLFQVKVD